MKKKICFVSLVIILAILNSLQAKDNRHLLKYIHQIEKAPLAEKTKPAYREILKFATQSDDVQVNISAVNCPWLNQKKGSTKWSSILLGAFIAGNIKPQIVSNIKGDNSYSGVLLALKTYQKIRKADKKYNIKELNRYAALAKKGKLQQELIKLEKKKK
jgi:hypothetical protein